MTICKIDGCGRGGKIVRGMCSMHYVAAMRAGLPRIRKEVEVCGFDGCGRTVESRGLCQAHATQLRRSGTLSPIRSRRGLSQCAEDGCGSTAHGRGLCRAHYAKAKRAGTLPPAPVRQRKPSSLPKPKPSAGLPDGWFRPTVKARKGPEEPSDGHRFAADDFVVPPLLPETRRAALGILAAHDALDLADMLGLSAEEVAA